MSLHSTEAVQRVLGTISRRSTTLRHWGYALPIGLSAPPFLARLLASSPLDLSCILPHLSPGPLNLLYLLNATLNGIWQRSGHG